MLSLKRGDNVQVMAGAEKGKRGKILTVDRTANRVVVQGVNLRYKHVKRSQENPQGGRIQVECPIHFSNVMLVDESTDKPTRFKAGSDKDGKKVRVSVKTGKPV